MKMIAILVFIVSLNAIQCQNFCNLMKTDGKYKGIHVYHSTVNKTYVMYKNGIQWEFDVNNNGVLEMKTNTNRSIDTAIVNRFGGNGYDCNVMNQSNTDQIVTKCTVGSDDTVSQYDRNALIFRASAELSNDWVVIYSKNGSTIWCYSPKVQSLSDRLVKDTKECKKKMGMKATDRLFLESMDRTIVAKIDGLVDFISGGYIDGHYVFINEKSGPRYCAQYLSDTEIECNSVANYTRIRADCFDGSDSQPENGCGLVCWIIIIVCFCLLVIVLAVCYTTGTFETIKGWFPKRKDDEEHDAPPSGGPEAGVYTTSEKTIVSTSEPSAVSTHTQTTGQTGGKPSVTQQIPGAQKQVINATPSVKPKVRSPKPLPDTTPKTPEQTGAKQLVSQQKSTSRTQSTNVGTNAGASELQPRVDESSQKVSKGKSKKQVSTQRALKSVSPGAAAPPSTPGPSQSVGADAGTSGTQQNVGDVQPSATIDEISQPGQQPRHVLTITTLNPQTARNVSRIWDIPSSASDDSIQQLRQLVDEVQGIDRKMSENTRQVVDLRSSLRSIPESDTTATAVTQRNKLRALEAKWTRLYQSLLQLLARIPTLLQGTGAEERPPQPNT